MRPKVGHGELVPGHNPGTVCVKVFQPLLPLGRGSVADEEVGVHKSAELWMVVLDCRLLTLRQTQLIAAAAARRLQAHGRRMTTAANAGDAEAAKWFSLLLIDEAHAVAPNSENVVSTQEFCTSLPVQAGTSELGCRSPANRLRTWIAVP